MKPRIVITVGDPAGIGPEIVAAAMRDPKVLDCCEPIVVGDPVAFAIHKKPLPKIEMVSSPGIRKTLKLGQPSEEAGRSAIEALQVAVGLIRSRQAVALVTAPVSKESLMMAKAGAPAHTEWLQKETKSGPVGMLMVAGRLRSLLLTRHVPLAQVSKTLTAKVIQDGAQLAHDFAKSVLGKAKPRLVLCGINPHAGDNGLIGNEELKTLVPALQALKKKGLVVEGPRPSDVVYREMMEKRYDIALAAYHDQGMIPLKVYAPERMVNVTIGLPFIRTSPAHGTAYDIAGQGAADASSIKEAIKLAALYSTASFSPRGRRQG